MVIIMDMESGSHLHADSGACCEAMPSQPPQSQTAWSVSQQQAWLQRQPQLQLGLQEILPDRNARR